MMVLMHLGIVWCTRMFYGVRVKRSDGGITENYIISQLFHTVPKPT